MSFKQHSPAIGIDLGTTYSAVGVIQHGKVRIIANELGSFTTASYVAFTEAERLIGDAAKKQAPMNPRNTIFDTKRLIGRKFDDEVVQQEMNNLPFKIIDRAPTPKIRVEYKGKRKEFFIEEISAMILHKMKEVAEAFLNQPIEDAVVTVPAYFNNSQRQATKNAARIAGLNVLRIINEPTAAALAYRHERKDIDGAKKKNILVYDLGGGTFDVSILTLEGTNAKVLATVGDPHLGGEDFDNRLIHYLVQEFKRKQGKDISKNENALRRLRTACEQEKRILSSATQTSIEIDALCDGINFSSRVTRLRFEELNLDLFKATLEPITKALCDAKLQKGDIDEIILVGGSTRIPRIQKLLFDFFDGKKELSKCINPDEAVAYGATVLAGKLSNEHSLRSFNLTLEDVTPLSLGIGAEEGYKVMDVVIKRNSAIPAKQTKRFYTLYDNQSEFIFPVYQGESQCTVENHKLGEFILKDIPAGPRYEVGADVTFHLDCNGILTVTAVDISNKRNKHFMTIENTENEFNKTQLKRLIRESAKYREEEKSMKQATEAKNVLQEECFRISAALRNEKTNSSGLIIDSTKAVLQFQVSEYMEWIDNNQMAQKEEYEQRYSKLRKLDPK